MMSRSITRFTVTAAIFLADCAKSSMDSKLIGKWETDDQGYKFDVVYRSDHTFEASGHSKGLNMVICTGTWHLENSCIVQEIKTYAEKYAEGTQRRWNITKLTWNTLSIDEWKKYQYTFKRIRPWWQII